MFQAAADEMERERKAKAGRVCGGRVFGYDNLEVTGPDGERSHVERVVNEEEAAVVRRILELRCEGLGLVRLAKQLNAEGAQLVAEQPTQNLSRHHLTRIRPWTTRKPP